MDRSCERRTSSKRSKTGHIYETCWGCKTGVADPGGSWRVYSGEYVCVCDVDDMYGLYNKRKEGEEDKCDEDLNKASSEASFHCDEHRLTFGEGIPPGSLSPVKWTLKRWKHRWTRCTNFPHSWH